MVRSGYSFKTAYGHIADVHARVMELGWSAGPLADRASTFGFVRWNKLCKDKNIKPIFGVELAVTQQLGDRRPVVDYWTFLAKDQLRPLHDLIAFATSNPGKDPSLTYNQALQAVTEGLFAVAGERCCLDQIQPMDGLYIGLSPATNKGLFNQAVKRGFAFVAKSDNLYPRAEDKELYRLALGWRSTTQTYPQWILSDNEWRTELSRIAPLEILERAIENRNLVFDLCRAELKTAKLLVPEKPQSLRLMCENGAEKLGINLLDEVYSQRLDRELAIIEQKNFEDYFYIIADLVNWARGRMLVGPGRGSSAGSLMCYMLDITEIDPIPHGLLFERFIDITRTDTPDIDLDFEKEKREQVFDYLSDKYGSHRVAKLGATGSMQHKSALNIVGAGLKISRWEIDKAAARVPFRTAGDESNDSLKEFFTTADGKDFADKYPNADMAAKLEGHPTNATTHAAGVLLTDGDIRDVVAVDSRTNTAMCDLEDAKELNLLKIDALGLIQLSIFERTQELIDAE